MKKSKKTSVICSIFRVISLAGCWSYLDYKYGIHLDAYIFIALVAIVWNVTESIQKSNNKEISIKTSFGILAARVGGDEQRQKILVFTRNSTGNEQMLFEVADQSISGDEDNTECIV